MLMMRTTAKYATTARPIHRHRLLGNLPSGKSSATTISMHRLRKDVQPPNHAGHSTQLVVPAPLSRALIAVNVVTRLTACTAATVRSSHPIP